MSRECFFISCVFLLVNLSLGQHSGSGIFDPQHLNSSHEFHMRLAGGKTPHEGRVEVYHDGQWGTVCDDDWDLFDAHVVCQYLNYSVAVSALDGDVYGGGEGPIWLDDLRCRGDESDLSKCESPGWGVQNCAHSEDAGVVCQPVIDPETPENLSPTEHAVDHGRALPDLLGALFDSGRDCDLQIGVEVDGVAAESICVHKLILTLDAEGSELSGPLSDLKISVTANCSHYVNSFVRYLYTGQINITRSSLQCIHRMASDWRINRLRDETGHLFSWVLPQDPTFQTQMSLYEYAVRVANRAMQRTCLRYLAWNFQDLVGSPAWAGAPLATVRALLSSSDLVVPGESYVLEALEKWEEGQAAASSQGAQDFGLLEHVRFPMMSAEDLYGLQGQRYQAGRALGFQFNALRFGRLLDEVVDQREAYTPRIYTGELWGFTFDSQEAQDYRRRRFFFRNHTRHDTLGGSFSTPARGDVSWSTELDFHGSECESRPACLSASLSKSHDCAGGSGSAGGSVILSSSTSAGGSGIFSGSASASSSPGGTKGLAYQNKIVLSCAGRYVFHVQDFAKDAVLIPDIGSAAAYPCESRSHTYQVVVRPMYTAGLKFPKADHK